MTPQTLTSEPDAIIGELMSPVGVSDPFPLYDRLRTIAPNHLSATGVRFVSGYNLCFELLRSTDFGQSFGLGSDSQGPDRSSFIDMIKESLILSNPPEHTRLRKLVSRAFSARQINELIPRIQD